MPWVYILHCADGSYYTGMTRGEEPDQRLSEHQMKLSPAYTATRLPVRLAYSEYFDLVADAIAAERRIKGWSRAKKEALIRRDWKLIQVLAKRRGGKDGTLSRSTLRGSLRSHLRVRDVNERFDFHRS